MTDTTIKCFLSVCETLNFTHAAEHLFMTQQAVSKQIASLEQELGYPLFHRSHRGITLTEAGSVYQALFSRWREELKVTQDTVSRLSAESHYIIRIGYLPRIQLPEALKSLIFRFKQEHSDVQIDYTQIAGTDMRTLLKDGVIDFCIAHSFLLDVDADFQVHHLCQVKQQIAVSTRHPLYAEPFNLASLSKMTCLYVMNEDKNEEIERAEIEKYFAAVGATLQQIRLVKNHEILELAVAMGEGCTICSDITTLSHRDNIRTLDTGYKSLLSVAWNRDNRSPVVKKLAQTFRFIHPQD